MSHQIPQSNPSAYHLNILWLISPYLFSGNYFNVVWKYTYIIQWNRTSCEMYIFSFTHPCHMKLEIQLCSQHVSSGTVVLQNAWYMCLHSSCHLCIQCYHHQHFIWLPILHSYSSAYVGGAIVCAAVWEAMRVFSLPFDWIRKLEN